jgi:2-polyprenyl-3-methyl-5-hydroxy-6-metoxy-1,4-benzoquinol methylase
LREGRDPPDDFGSPDATTDRIMGHQMREPPGSGGGMTDTRAEPATFYDLNPNLPDDMPFYVGRLPSPGCRVLELGCGTGRDSIPLAEQGASVYGVDRSQAMVRR